MTQNIIKGWKTTIIGIVLFIAGITYLLINSSPDYIVLGVVLSGGVGMIFSPDPTIDKILSLITKTK